MKIISNNSYTFFVVFLMIIFGCNQNMKSTGKQNEPTEFSENVGLIGNDTVRIIGNFVQSEVTSENLISFIKVYLDDRMIIKDSIGGKFYLNFHFLNYDSGAIILLKELNPINNDWYRVVTITGNVGVFSEKRFIADTLGDIDNDGIIEIGGYMANDAYCVDCDSVYYNPIEIYEISLNRISLDSSYIYNQTIRDFGCFIGYNPQMKVVPFFSDN